MASVVGFLKSNSVSLTNGTKVVTLTGSVDCSYVVSGTAVYINNILLEGVSGTPIDGSGNSTITLREVFTGTTVAAGSLIAFNTIEGLRDAIQKAKDTTEGALELQSSFETLLMSTTSSVDITINGVVTSLTPYQYLADQMNILLTSLDQVDNTSDLNKPISTDAKLLAATHSKAEFFAQAKQRIRENTGSGFSEMGKPYDNSASIEVQQGIWVRDVAYPVANALMLGSTIPTSGNGLAKSIINGISSTIAYVNSSGVFGCNIQLPPAPDGTKTYDSATNTVVQHASAAIAFAAETTTNKVIISRKDFLMLEMWHEKISDKGLVYPLGGVQSGISSWEGISLVNNVVAQGYSAFGEWDTVTKGYGAVWSTLSDADKTKFIQDHENNIYNDDGELIQVRYRVRVIEGLGDEWDNVNPANLGTNVNFAEIGGLHVSAQGSSDISVGLRLGSSSASSFRLVDSVAGILSGGDKGIVSTWEGESQYWIKAIPIALVQRRNQGIGHPLNPNGTWLVGRNDASTNGELWSASNAYVISSRADCFNPTLRAKLSEGGMIGGVSGRYQADGKFYDAIYADDVKDLRVSTRDLTERDKFDAIQADISGESRGFEDVPFTRVTVVDAVTNQTGRTLIRDDSAIASMFSIFGGFASGQAEGIYVYSHSGGLFKVDSINTDGTGDFFYLAGEHASEFTISDSICYHNKQTHQSNNPSWTDIIGDPANISATFPNGVEGQWIPITTTGTLDFPLNRKSLDSGTLPVTWSNDSGVVWATGSQGMDVVTNVLSSWDVANGVTLVNYTTKSNPLELADNAEVIGALGDVFALNGKTSAFGVNFVSNMIGKIANGGSSSGRVQLPLSIYATDIYKELNATLGVSHATPPLDPNIVSPAVKAFPYLTQENGQYFLQWVYKEMVWDHGLDNGSEFTNRTKSSTDATTINEIVHITDGRFTGYWKTLISSLSLAALSDISWSKDIEGNIIYQDGTKYFEPWDGNGFGENNQFTIVDGETTEPDDNGNNILIGQKRRALPFFTGRNE